LRGFINLGIINGIRLRAHFTLLIFIAFLIIFLYIQYSRTFSLNLNILLLFTVSVIYIISVLARSITQTLLALKRGIKVKSINLFAFGGLYRIAEDTNRPVQELLVALTGFCTNLVLASVFFILLNIADSAQAVFISEILIWSVYINVMLSVLNLLPGLPLDAGRVLRVVLWKRSNDYIRALAIASITGIGIGAIIIVSGVLQIFVGGILVTGILLIIIGVCIIIAAQQFHYHSKVYDALFGIKVKHLMKENYTPINPQLTIGLVHDYVINSGQRCFLVVDQGDLLGIVTLKDLRVNKKHLKDTFIRQVMTPRNKLITTGPDELVAPLFEEMIEMNLMQVPVIKEGRIAGLLFRENLNRFLVAKAILG
jgi:Zn-dependent protease/predicted transcriptional regulator